MARWPIIRPGLVAAGLVPGTWATEGGNFGMTPADARFAIAEVEGPLAAPLLRHDFACLTECYTGENPNATPVRMDFAARQCGFRRVQPVFGCYAGKSLADFPTNDRAFPGWSVWTFETVL